MRISALCCDSDSCVAEIEILSFTLIEPGVILILLLSTTLILQIGCHPKQGAGGVVGLGGTVKKIHMLAEFHRSV